MPFFFFRELQLIIVFLLICDSYMSLSTRFVSLKLFVGFYILDSVFIKVYIFVQKKNDSLTLKRLIPFKIKIREKLHNFVPRPLIFKLQQEVTCVNLLNLKNQSFENVRFSQS